MQFRTSEPEIDHKPISVLTLFVERPCKDDIELDLQTNEKEQKSGKLHDECKVSKLERYKYIIALHEQS